MQLKDVVGGYYHQFIEGQTSSHLNSFLLGADVDEWQIPRQCDEFMYLPISLQVDDLVPKVLCEVWGVEDLHPKVRQRVALDLEGFILIPPAQIGISPLTAPRYDIRLGILRYAVVEDDLVKSVDVFGKEHYCTRIVWKNYPSFPISYKGTHDMRLLTSRVKDGNRLTFKGLSGTRVFTKEGYSATINKFLSFKMANG